VRGLWAVRYQPQGLPWEPSMDWHALLLMALPGGTKALRTDEELDELPPAAAGLRLGSATLLAGNLLRAARIVQACRPTPRPRPGCPAERSAPHTQLAQRPAACFCPGRWAQALRGASVAQVHPLGVVVLAGTTKLQEVLLADVAPAPPAPGVTVAAASVADPYLLLHTSDGGGVLLEIDAEDGEAAARSAMRRLSACTAAHPPRALAFGRARGRAREHGERAAQGCWRARRSRARCGRRRAGASSPPAACMRTPAAGCRRG